MTIQQKIIPCLWLETQAEEAENFWDARTVDGGEPIMCGWLKDRYGLRWQIVPRALIEMMTDPDRAKVRRAMEAMMDDPRMQPDNNPMPFDDKRMIFGGFVPIVER